MKIAICISGEVRSWKETNIRTPMSPKDHLKHYVALLRWEGHTVDIYGHTWNYCDVSDIKNDTMFSNLDIDDISVVESWVTANIDKLREYHGSDVSELEMLNCHAQPYGIIQSMRSAGDTYDIYQRTRWDIISDNYYIHSLECDSDRAQVFADSLSVYKTLDSVKVIIDDKFFGFTNRVYLENLYGNDTADVLTRKFVSSEGVRLYISSLLFESTNVWLSTPKDRVRVAASDTRVSLYREHHDPISDTEKK